MGKVFTYLKAHYKQGIAIIIVVLILYGLYQWWKQRNTVTVVDDNGNPVTITPTQTAQANALAERLQSDLNSGTLFGYNVFGMIGRDLDAYALLAQSSDTIFALTVAAYKSKYQRSLIADIAGESSIAGGTHVNDILAVAQRLNLS